MQALISKFIALLALLFFGVLAGEPIELTDANFDHDTQIGGSMTTGAWFIKFYAPWCGHCKKMIPAWETVVDELKIHNINVAQVDATVNRDVAQRFGVNAYPSLLFFKDSKMYKYKGPREVDMMTEFALRKYARADASEIPGPLTIAGKVKKSVLAVLHDLATVSSQHRSAAALIFFIGTLIGSSVGFLLGTLLVGRFTNRHRRAAAKPKSKKGE